MLQSSSEFNNLGAGVGAGGFGGFPGMGGMGGFGLIGLIGLQDLFNRDRDHGHRGGDDSCAKEIATLAAIGNLKDVSVAEARALSGEVCGVKDKICDLEKTDMQQFYAAAIQASNNTQAIKDQAQALAIVADKRFDDLAAAGAVQTAAILARINDAEVQQLRDQLLESRHSLRGKEVEISIQNTNTAIAQQMQAQQQQQMQRDNEHARRFDALFGQVAVIGNQVAKSTNDIVNIGGLVAASQAANPVNVK